MSAATHLSGTLLSIFDLLSNILDEFLLLGPFLVLQAKSLVLRGGKKANVCQFQRRPTRKHVFLNLVSFVRNQLNSEDKWKST